MNSKEVLNGIKECLNSCNGLKDHLVVDLEKVNLLTNLRQDTVFDDLDWMMLKIELEEYFNIEITDDEMDDWKIVGDIVDTILTLTAKIDKKEEGEKKYPHLKSRFEIITRDVDTLADFLFHITEDLPWFAREERLERIKRFLQETP